MELTLLERARFRVVSRIAQQRAATYLIPGYLRGEMDDSEAVQSALADLVSQAGDSDSRR